MKMFLHFLQFENIDTVNPWRLNLFLLLQKNCLLSSSCHSQHRFCRSNVYFTNRSTILHSLLLSFFHSSPQSSPVSLTKRKSPALAKELERKIRRQCVSVEFTTTGKCSKSLNKHFHFLGAVVLEENHSVSPKQTDHDHDLPAVQAFPTKFFSQSMMTNDDKYMTPHQSICFFS